MNLLLESTYTFKRLLIRLIMKIYCTHCVSMESEGVVHQQFKSYLCKDRNLLPLDLLNLISAL